MTLKFDLQQFISCPDCKAHEVHLDAPANQMTCQNCNWSGYLSSDQRLLDLLPSTPEDVVHIVKKQDISDYYASQFEQSFPAISSMGTGWGISSSTSRQQLFHSLLLGFIRKVVSNSKNKNNGVLIDLSAGSGDYTFEFSSEFNYIIHCEIDSASLIESKHRADQAGIKNIIFVRADFLRIPFASNKFDVVLLLDSLEYYGLEKDREIIKCSAEILNKNGLLFADFHRKKPFRINNRLYEYTRRDIYNVIRYLPQKMFKLETHCVIGRLSSISFTSKKIYNLMRRMFFLPAVRSLCAIRRLN